MAREPPFLRRNKPQEEQKAQSKPDAKPAKKPDFRTWSDLTGNFQVEAVLVDSKDDQVTLRKRDGQTVVVPLQRLSEADRAHVAATEQADESPRPAKGSEQDTELIGGTEGWPFRHEDEMPLLGIRYRLGGWAGEKTLGKITPVFDRQAKGGSQATVIAKDGYAVGALNVDAQKFVNAMQVVFMRLTPEGRLDPSDSYQSDWIGFRTTRPTETVGGTGTTIVGVYGRHGAILNAVGLVRSGSDRHSNATAGKPAR